MPETDRLGVCSDWLELDFVQKEATPPPVMKLGIELYMDGLSRSDTVSCLEWFGVNRARSTVHNWAQKAEFQPADGRSPDHDAVDEPVIWLSDCRY